MAIQIPGAPEQDLMAAALSEIARGDPASAETLLLARLTQDPTCAQANHQLSLLAYARGDGPLAEQLMRRAILTDPLEPEYHNNLGVVLNARGDPNAARLSFENAIALRPNLVEAINNLGAALEASGDNMLAIATYRRALEIDPGYVEARDNLDLACSRAAPAWHFPMMADTERNAAYDAALRRAAPGRRVLDIGTGSGLLAMMAARAGAASVATCETVVPIARAARAIIAANGFSDRITLHASHSHNLQGEIEMADRAEVLVTETFASGVLSEAVLPTIEHARRNLLTADATIIPRRAAAFGYLVGGAAIEAQFFAPDAAGFDLSGFDHFAPSKVGLHLDRLHHEVMSDDFEIFDFDLTQWDFPAARRALSVKATRAGRCVGVAQWLRLELDAETTYENRPKPDAGANGWMHVLYRFQTPRQIAAGEVVALIASHSRTAMTVALAPG